MTERPIDESSSLESPTVIKECFVDALKRKPLKGKKKNALQKWQNNILGQIEGFLKREDFNVNFCEDEISQSPLWQATMRFEIFNQVLERKETDANLFDLKHRTAMFLAVESKDLQIMESLKKAGALIDWKDNEGRTPLSLAAELGHLETLKFLFEKGHAKIDLHDDLHRTPLQWAITSGSTDIVRYLLANAADVNHRDLHHRTPLFLAVELDSFQVKEEIINLLIERGANPNLAGDEEKTPLIHAVLQSDIATVKQLLDPKYSTVNVNQYAEGRTALSLAIEHGSTEIIKMLIPKAEVNMEDDNSLKRTPLAWAIEKGNFWATMELLEDNRTDVHRPNPHGRTPFSLAAGKERVAIMQLLIRHGADPHWEDNDHHTGFWWFLKARSDYAFSMSIDLRKQAPKVPRGALAKLIDSLPRPNRQDSSGRSWLSWAAEYGDEIVVEYFLKKKDVHPNQCDKTAGTFARTPVIWAAEKHHESLVRLMIEQRKDDFSLNYVIRHSKVYEGELGEERMLTPSKRFFPGARRVIPGLRRDATPKNRNLYTLPVIKETRRLLIS